MMFRLLLKKLLLFRLLLKKLLLFRLLLKKLLFLMTLREIQLEDDEKGPNGCCDDDAVLRGKQ